MCNQMQNASCSGREGTEDVWASGVESALWMLFPISHGRCERWPSIPKQDPAAEMIHEPLWVAWEHSFLFLTQRFLLVPLSRGRGAKAGKVNKEWFIEISEYWKKKKKKKIITTNGPWGLLSPWISEVDMPGGERTAQPTNLLLDM